MQLLRSLGDTRSHMKRLEAHSALGTHYSELFEAECLAERGRVTPMGGRTAKTWFCLDLPLVEYAEAWQLQGKLVAARKSALIPSDILLLLEHAPVFTLGRRGGRENLKVSEKLLEHSGMPLFQVERGGNITYHGPGQVVGYGIVDLQAAGLSVVDYVTGLEEVMMRTAAEWGVPAERNPLNRGIWVGSRKLGSIGIAVRRGITFHGFAFNAKVSLAPFAWINPCGLEGVGVTSLACETAREVSLAEVRRSLKHNLEAVFGLNLIPVELGEIERLLQEKCWVLSAEC